MAPSRRKGASKAAAAAAARRQWKVGDLVLAKVKGFPAWPATVSEPEKWGYATDWKKVLVYFFGTQQIAFCNPADVEPFTEEKKQSLLIKRHGKGADFVRAVKEIVESYEKLKKQDQDDAFISEVAHINGGNLVDSSSNVESKDQLEAPEATFDSQCKSSYSNANGNEPHHHSENALATVRKDGVDGKEEPTDSSAVAEKPLSTLLRKRSKDLSLQNGVSQRKEAIIRKSRSSSRLESCKLRGSAVHCNDSGKSVADISATVTRDGLLQRNKQKGKSRDASECDDVDSSAFVSSGSTEDNGSEIVTMESDTLSFNEGSTIDSGCKIEHSETLVGCVDGDVDLTKGLDLKIKALVIKKKRKANRKRPNNDAVESIVIVDKEAGVQNTSESFQNACGKMNEGGPREDGDEHLPLVKRARVRMGESSLKESNSLSSIEVNTPKEVTIHTSGAINKSLHCDDSIDRDSFVINAAMDVSPSRGTQLHESKPQLWKPKKEQSFGCSVDGEAALPPSKRLHRALEAMSANAAEEGQSNNDVSLDMNTRTSVHSISPIGRSPDVNMTMEDKRACEVVLQNVNSTGSAAQGVDASEIATSFNTIAVESAEFFEMGFNNKKFENSSSLNNKSGEECFPDDGKQGDEKNPCGGPDNCELAVTAVPTQSPRNLSPGPDRKKSDVLSVQGSADEVSLLMDKGNTESIELINYSSDKMEQKLDEPKCTARSMDTVSDTHDDIVKVSPQCGTGVVQLKTESTVCENTRSNEPPLDDNREENYMSEVAIEVTSEQREEDPSSRSFPNGRLDGSAIHSSPSLTDGGDSLAQASPANASLGHASTSDNSRFFQNNDSCSPDVHLHDKITMQPPVVDEEGKFESVVTQRPKSLGRYTESNAALSSFEAMLGTLTRTKESIGRATRVAIDCARFGGSSKVVDVLARCLETESSLHRRVDLFFLVDSILKGDVGGWYTSAIQAMLPRLLAAAGPPGSSAQENRRQCLKVLRLWLEREILPESIIRRHMRELDSYGGSSGAFSRRSMRTERSLDDPLREMEGMLVDEYGSNSSFQLPGFCMPSILKDEDEGSDSDGGSFEAVTPEHSPEKREDHEQTPVVEKHRHILEDVDGELEMEDVAPSCETELTSSSGAIGAVAGQISQNRFEPNTSLPFAPPLPQDVPPSSPPLPSSPPPPPPLPPALHPPCFVSAPYANGMDSKLYADAHNMQDTMVQSVAQQSNAPRINHYHPSECRDHQRQMPESFPGPNFHDKGYPVRPPHPPPSSQFSYVREEQHFKPQREGTLAPPYSNSHHFVQNWDRENFYNNHERMKQAPHEHYDSCRFPPHSFSGPYPGKVKSYGPVPFVGPPSEQTRLPDQGWRFPPRSMSHRNSMPFRPPPLEGPIPVSSRGPGFWRPR